MLLPNIAQTLHPFLRGFQEFTGGKTDDVEASNFVGAKDFIFRYVFTMDPHDKKMPIKRFPYSEYTDKIIDTWLAEDMLLMVKSRQMMASWLFVALHLWDAMFHKGRMNFFVSKKEADAGFDNQLSLLSRAKFIYDRLPESMKVKIKCITKPNPKMEFPELNSSILGMSQDSEGLRQYTASRILSDEMAFQERAEEAYIAMKPTLDGGGCLTGISTPNGRNNLFYYLVNDVKKGQKIKPSEDVGEISKVGITSLCKGLGLRRNRNGFAVLSLHWSAAPWKDNKWMEQSKKSYSSDDSWRQEQELDFNKTEGTRVFPGFRFDTHVSKIVYNKHQTIWRGWDFGYHHPACVWVQMDEDGKLKILHELLGEEILINDFAAEVKRISRVLFPAMEFKDAGDPAGQATTDKSKRSTIDILRSLGFRINMRKRNVADGINVLRGLLIPLHDERPRLTIDPACEILVDGFLGGYVRDDEDDPIKDGYYEHLFDALRYFINVNYDPKSYKPFQLPRVYIPKLVGI